MPSHEVRRTPAEGHGRLCHPRVGDSSGQVGASAGVQNTLLTIGPRAQERTIVPIWCSPRKTYDLG
jgi:hypothetical protein